MKTYDVVCKPNAFVVGVDPGEVAGAVAVIATDDHGAPRLVRSASWRKMRRKSGDRWRITNAQNRDAYEVNHYASELARLFPDAVSAWSVEGLFNAHRRGLLTLAESAGVALGIGWNRYGVAPVRPLYRDWTKRMVRMPAGTRSREANVLVRSAYGGAFTKLRPAAVVDWSIGVGSPSVHEVDAVGLALYAAGGRLVVRG